MSSLVQDPASTSSFVKQQPGDESRSRSRRESQPHVPSNSFLDVPTSHASSTRPRSSLDSTFTDLSDLTYMSNDHHAFRPLIRTASNASNYSTYSVGGSKSTRQRLVEVYHQNYGAFLVLLSQFFGSGMNVATSLLEQSGAHGPPMHPFQILLTRQSLTALLCAVYALTTGAIPYYPLGPPDRKVRLLLVCRGVAGFFGVFGMYFSLLYLPLSEATVLTFLAPILTCYACSLLIPGERFTKQQQLAGCVSLIGVIFIAQPASLFASSASSSSVSTPSSSTTTDGLDGVSSRSNTTFSTTNPGGPVPSDHDSTHPTPSQHLFAIGVAMLGVVGSTIAMTSIRSIGTRAHAFISVNYFSVWSSIVSLVATIVLPDVNFRLPSNSIEWALLLSLGICGFIMQALLTMGLAYGGPASSNNGDSQSTSQASEGTMAMMPTSARSGPHSDRNIKDKSVTYEEDIEMQSRAPISNHTYTSLSPPAEESSSSTTILPITTSTQQHHNTNNHNDAPLTHKVSRKTTQRPKPTPSGNRATSMIYCQMLFALAADKLIFNTTPSLWSWVGSGLILTGAVWVAAAKDGKSDNPSRHKDIVSRMERPGFADGTTTGDKVGSSEVTHGDDTFTGNTSDTVDTGGEDRDVVFHDREEEEMTGLLPQSSPR